MNKIRNKKVDKNARAKRIYNKNKLMDKKIEKAIYNDISVINECLETV